MAGLGDWFGGRFAELMGAYPEPPDAVPLRILGLAAMPASRDEVRSAFRARLLAVHPDVAAYEAVSELQKAAEAVAAERPEVAEVVWARDVLLRKIPPPPVTANGVPGGEVASRYEPPPSRVCKQCAGKRLGYDGKPYRLTGWGSRWAGYCTVCVRDLENEQDRDLRRQRRADRTCQAEGCGRVFTPSRSDGRYCTPACRQRVYRQRAR